MYGNWLFFETPDNYLVSLDAATGKERWHVQIADVKQEYFSTPRRSSSAITCMVGTGGDSLDVPGFLEVARSGNRRTAVEVVDRAAARKAIPAPRPGPTNTPCAHGGGMTWIPGTYDPELNLYYIGTGNPESGR